MKSIYATASSSVTEEPPSHGHRTPPSKHLRILGQNIPTNRVRTYAKIR